MLYDNMLVSALDKVGTFVGKVLSEKNPLASIKLEATASD